MNDGTLVTKTYLCGSPWISRTSTLESPCLTLPLHSSTPRHQEKKDIREQDSRAHAPKFVTLKSLSVHMFTRVMPSQPGLGLTRNSRECKAKTSCAGAPGQHRLPPRRFCISCPPSTAARHHAQVGCLRNDEPHALPPQPGVPRNTSRRSPQTLPGCSACLNLEQLRQAAATGRAATSATGRYLLSPHLHCTRQ
jgi:hypothetical protein